MHIIEMSSEAVPFAKTGGLADVVGALPKPMARAGQKISLFMPLYRSVREAASSLTDTSIRVHVPLAGVAETGEIWTSKLPGADVNVFFVGHKEFFDRDGLYGNSAGDFHDNSRRFIFFTRAVLEAAKSLPAPVDIIHCHDWQTALAPVYARTLYANAFAGARTVLTLHNLSFQGIFWHWDMNLAGLPWELFDWKHLEFFGKMNFLKGGIVFADALTTVSPRYSIEIQTPEFGCGLEGVLAERRDRLHGILNGIDEDVWSPERDSKIPAHFSVSDLSGKRACKAQLQKRTGLPERNVPVFGMISRLTEQKGVDLLLGALPALLEDDVQVVILGSGDSKLQGLLQEFARRFAGKLSLTVAFDDRLAHEIEAGADMFLMPSRFEPCGLNQMYSLRYGTVPIVRETGGLADTVVDCTEDTMQRRTATGFRFIPCTVEAFLGAIHRSLTVYRRPDQWNRLRENGMKQKFGWDTSAARYIELFRHLLEG
ncbi:MAG: glycogen synthase GlgA [Planctomycetes bacterium]|nr:glycogen synthase GlgA [Planctomycetota bacterium]MBI3843484.1 glycogen synthase GlgA [Planctomycetota bacterium]